MADLELLDTSSLFVHYFQDKNHFVTFEEFQTIFQQFQTASSSLFRVKNSASVERENQRRKEPIPIQMKYANICFCCVHYGTAKRRGNGIRTFQRYLPQHCPAFVQLIYKSSQKALVITNKSLVHNHNLSPESFNRYAANRRLTKDEEYKVRDVIKLGVGNAFLKELFYNKFHKQLTLKDIKNLKTRIQLEDKKNNANDVSKEKEKTPESIIASHCEDMIPFQSSKTEFLLRTTNNQLFKKLTQNLGQSYCSETIELSKQLEQTEDRSVVTSSSELIQDSPTITQPAHLWTMVWTSSCEANQIDKTEQIQQVKGEPMVTECKTNQNELLPADCSHNNLKSGFCDIGVNTDGDPLLTEVCRLRKENLTLKQSLKDIQELSKVISNLCGTPTHSN